MTMNPDWLLKHFEQISEAPDAVPRLRRFILDLAVRGRLVEQNPEDEPASELLKRVATEKHRLAEEGQIRKQEPLPPIREDEVPFNVPKNWKLVRLGEVSTLITKGSTPTSYGHSFVQHGINFVKVEAIKAGLLLPENITSHINSETHEFLKRSQLKRGDFLFSIAGSIGTCAVVTEQILPANTNQALAIIRGANLAFLLGYLSYSSSSDLLGFTVAKARGGAMNNISLEDVSNFILPLPPLAEQHRIVAKVDELMTLCDQLEASQAKRERRRDRLVAATLHGLGRDVSPKRPELVGRDGRDRSPSGPMPSVNSKRPRWKENGGFGETALPSFFLNHLPCLTTRPEHIHQLRQTILNLAVRGKLVPRESGDEPVWTLLSRIRSEKNRLSSAGSRKKQNDANLLDDSSLFFQVPKSWAWTTCRELALEFRYGTSKKCGYETKGHPVLRIPNLSGGKITTEDLKFTKLNEREVEDLSLSVGDILMIRSNGSLNLVGRPALVEEHVKGFCYAGYLVRVRFVPDTVDSRYLIVVLNSKLVRDQIEVPIRSAVGLKNVNSTELGNIRIPLPPLAEQHRIVRKVDELMALCDELEARLTTTATTRRQLFEGTLHEALTGHQKLHQMAVL